jgi:Leucine-rich repeat (LRR) protein
MYSLSQASKQRRSEEDYEANPSPQMLVSDQNTRGNTELTTTRSQTQDRSRENPKGNNKKKTVDDNITPPSAPDTGDVAATTTQPPFARNSYDADPQDCVVKEHATPGTTESFIPAISSPDTPVPTRKSRTGLRHGVTVGAIRVAGPQVNDENAQDNDSLDICSVGNDPSTYTPLDTAPTAERPFVATCVSDTEADIEAQVESRMQSQAEDIEHVVRRVLMTNVAIPVEVKPSVQDAPSVATNEEGAKKKKICIVAIVLLAIIVAAVGAGVGISVSSNKSTGEPVSARVKAFQEFLVPVSGEQLKDTSSPQFQALIWLANDDAANMTIGVDREIAIKTRYVAAVLYYAFQGDSWHDKYNFLSEKSTCEWNRNLFDGLEPPGISCGTDGTIVSSFRSPANNLKGPIPPEITYLSNLKTIDVLNNTIDGTLSHLANLSRLERLDLTRNAFTGSLPEFLFRYEQLNSLVLDNNLFDGTISHLAGKSPNLKYFSISENSLVGQIPSSIGQNTVLQSLALLSNQLTGTIPEFASDSKMVHLLIGNNKLNGTIPTTIGSLSALQLLGLFANDFSGTIPTEISNCQKIIHVDVGENSLSGNIGQVVDSLSPSLVVLDASRNLLEGIIPTSVGILTKLTFLDLQDNNVGGVLPSELGLLNQLEVLDIAFNEFTGSVPLTLANLSNLATLLLVGNNLNGSSLDSLCSINIDFFAANTCSEPDKIECSCCTYCCDPGETYCDPLV